MGTIFEHDEDLHRAISEALRAVPVGVLLELVQELIEADARKDAARVAELATSLRLSLQLMANDDYRLAAKQVARADEDEPPSAIDRRALFASLRAG